MIEILTSILIIVGVFFILVSSVGMLRLPDVYTRMHAATKSATVGVTSLLLATVVFFSAIGETLSAKQLLTALFIFITAPVGAHMISRSAYYTGVPMVESINEMTEDTEPSD